MIRINEWEIFTPDMDHGWMRRHKYSNFEEPTDPPPPPTYRSPSPDNVAANAAAFAAQVGINADPLFSFDAATGANFDAFDIDAFLNSAGAGNPFAANLGESNDVNPADLDTGSTGQGQADSYAAE